MTLTVVKQDRNIVKMALLWAMVAAFATIMPLVSNNNFSFFGIDKTLVVNTLQIILTFSFLSAFIGTAASIIDVSQEKRQWLTKISDMILKQTFLIPIYLLFMFGLVFVYTIIFVLILQAMKSVYTPHIITTIIIIGIIIVIKFRKFIMKIIKNNFKKKEKK